MVRFWICFEATAKRISRRNKDGVREVFRATSAIWSEHPKRTERDNRERRQQEERFGGGDGEVLFDLLCLTCDLRYSEGEAVALSFTRPLGSLLVAKSTA